MAAGAIGAVAQVRTGVTSGGEQRCGRGGYDACRSGTRRFRIGSVTKTFVATVVLQLADEGQLRLDDPVEAVAARSRTGRRAHHRAPPVEPHQRLVRRHASTLPMPPSQEFLDNRWRTWTATETGRARAGPPPTVEPPGAAFAYSNTNYLLLGVIVEKVTGRSYGDEVGAGSSSRCGWRHRGAGDVAADRRATPARLRPDRKGLIDFTKMNPSMMGASGEMISTTADLDRFFDALLGGRLLPVEAARRDEDTGCRGSTVRTRPGQADTSCGIRSTATTATR